MSADQARLRIVSTRVIRAFILFVSAGAIAGMIISSVANNERAAISFGLVVSTGAVVLLAITAVDPARGAKTDHERLGEVIEDRLMGLVARGTDEVELRSLVRDAVTWGRSTSG
jgi:hypothetical protein